MIFFSHQIGDKVKVVSRVDADWVVGELRGKKGMFPASFVDKVPDNLPQDSGGDSKEKTESPSKSSDSGGQPSLKPAATTKKVADCTRVESCHNKYCVSFGTILFAYV